MRMFNDRIKVVNGYSPQDSAEATVASAAAITRDKNYEEAVAIFQVGTASGTPDSYTVTHKVQHKNLSGDSWEDFVTPVVVTADNTVTKIDLDAKSMKNLVQLVSVIDFTNGTSPKIEVSSVLVYGEAKHI